MAHLHLRRRSPLDASAAIFSPSAARIAASTARDWSYVDSWLASKFPAGRPVPPFERNQDTLTALLALAAANEAADEERQLLARADADALAALDDRQRAYAAPASEIPALPPQLLRSRLLTAIEDELPSEGKTALDCLAGVAVRAGAAFPEPQDLGHHIVGMQATLFETEHMVARVESLRRHIQREADQAADLLRSLQSHHYTPSTDSAKQNLDLQRKTRAMSAQLLELRDRAAANACSSADAATPHSRVTIHDVSRQEHDFLALLARSKELDAQMAAFEGLPSDPDLARIELDALRHRLRGLTSRRDAAFEGLVEGDSPAKRH